MCGVFFAQPTATCQMSGMSLELGDKLSEAALPCSGYSVAHLLVGHTCLYWTS